MYITFLLWWTYVWIREMLEWNECRLFECYVPTNLYCSSYILNSLLILMSLCVRLCWCFAPFNMSSLTRSLYNVSRLQSSFHGLQHSHREQASHRHTSVSMSLHSSAHLLIIANSRIAVPELTFSVHQRTERIDYSTCRSPHRPIRLTGKTKSVSLLYIFKPTLTSTKRRHTSSVQRHFSASHRNRRLAQSHIAIGHIFVVQHQPIHSIFVQDHPIPSSVQTWSAC